MAGEDSQLTGQLGLHNAKRWLDKSTRVAKAWSHEDLGLKELLEFTWPHDNAFSFDLGGQFRGEKLEGQYFLAEIKNYKNESDLPEHYRSFLAKCYVAFTKKPQLCDHFLWISWSPFQARKWDHHTTAAMVKDSVLREKRRIFDTEDEGQALSLLDVAAVSAVADRVWLITLCDKQLQLVLSPEHHGEVMKLMKVNEG